MRWCCDTSQEPARWSPSMKSRCPPAPGFFLENNPVRAAPGVRIYSRWLTQSLLPKAIRASLQKLILVLNQSSQHSRMTQALGSLCLRLQCPTLSRAQVWESQLSRNAKQEQTPGTSLSHSQTEGCSVKPQPCSWALPPEERQVGLWLQGGGQRDLTAQVRQQISWESEWAEKPGPQGHKWYTERQERGSGSKIKGLGKGNWTQWVFSENTPSNSVQDWKDRQKKAKV